MGIQLRVGGAITGRKFTDPIRYFKANDPYYWEVDNIPLKQLQENCKYINDRLNSAVVSGNLEVNRADISELRPYVNGSDSKIRVKPGRYTARINNANNIDNLESFYKLSIQLGEYSNYHVLEAGEHSASFLALIERIKSAVSTDALNLNGMSERVFAYMAQTPHFGPATGDIDSNYPQLTIPLQSNNPTTQSQAIQNAFPLTEYISWFKYAWSAQHLMGSGAGNAFQSLRRSGNNPNELLNLAFLENVLVRYWRGTARTSVVDIPNELEIDIPLFDKKDFFYTDTGGNRQELGDQANSRIDLVFIYSKPVDVSSIDIAKYTGTPATRTTITEPILGIVRGAGLGFDQDSTVTVMSNTNSDGEGEGYKHKASINTGDGVSKIMANIADQNNTDNGFKVGVNQKVAIHGSFPSPEDLMNLAPLLGEELTDDSWLLTGQTVFPVAYVKVNKGSAVIGDDDIVDIRPLFRTAELTYNERAGIAAAVPPLSLANRAVGRYELEYEMVRHYENLDGRLSTLEGSTQQGGGGGGTLIKPTVVGGGYIFGGRNWGVEGTLMQGLVENNIKKAATKTDIEQLYGIPLGTIPDLPDWDMSDWALLKTNTGQPNDWICNARAREGVGVSRPTQRADYGLWYTSRTGGGNNTAGRKSFGSNKTMEGGNEPTFNMYFVKKTIRFDPSLLEGMDDYTVNVQYHNCCPLGQDFADAGTTLESGGGPGIWVEKNVSQGLASSFTIYVAWHAQNTVNNGTRTTGSRLPTENRGNASYYAGMAVINQAVFPTVDLSQQTSPAKYAGQSAVGVSLYPTVYFSITGYPAGFLSYGLGSRGGSVITPTLL